MKMLGFDTCLDKMYIALSDDNEILDSKIVETTKEHYHSAFLISTIRDILKENNLTPQNIDVIATNIGPGSFTGIRACVTAARVFAQGVNKDIKTIGVSSLEILSRIRETGNRCKDAKMRRGIEEPRVHASTPLVLSDRCTLVALDARKEMAYVAIFDGRKEILAPKTILIEELNEILTKNDYTIITDDKLELILGGISYQKQDKNLGKYLIQIAKEKLETGCDTNWKKLYPLYIQPPPITVKK